MKVFVYCGSYRNDKSVGYNFIREVESKLADKKITFDIYTPQNCNIEFCRGCMSCFAGGVCPIHDEFEEIKESIWSSEFIIFVSPVYAHNVSGSIKNMIDRMSYLTHLMPFEGKKGAIISVSHDNGNSYVNDYLYKIFSYLGIDTIKPISIQSNIMDCDIKKSYSIFLAEEIERFSRLKNIESSREHEKLFAEFTKRYKSNYKDSPDAKRWNKLGYFEASTFGEVIQRRPNNNNLHI